jgi:hypothetical protein
MRVQLILYFCASWLPTFPLSFPALPLLRVGVTGKRVVDWSEHSSEKAARGMKTSSSLSSLCLKRRDGRYGDESEDTEQQPGQDRGSRLSAAQR